MNARIEKERGSITGEDFYQLVISPVPVPEENKEYFEKGCSEVILRMPSYDYEARCGNPFWLLSVIKEAINHRYNRSTPCHDSNNATT